MLVIIGLLVGGVLVGRDLIVAAGVRAQISQIERYNTAADTFRGKYGYLPGDIKDPDASSFGFQARGPYPGEGDGNGVIEGNGTNSTVGNEGVSQCGETLTFWEDLSKAGLMDGNFSAASPAAAVTSSNVSSYLPAAKIGRGNNIAVWSGGPVLTTSNGSVYFGNSLNYFSISAGIDIGVSQPYCIFNSIPALTVQEAYRIDSKIDDGLPQSGRVMAVYVTPALGVWGMWTGAASGSNGPTTTATSGSSTTCYDNGNTAGLQQTYSLTQSNGNGVNCALSFQMQAGD